jgi:hypothetical protein
MEKIKELDSVALLKDIPTHDLEKGDVGTIVTILNENTVEVEFINQAGETIANLPLTERDYIRLNLKTAPA